MGIRMDDCLESIAKSLKRIDKTLEKIEEDLRKIAPTKRQKSEETDDNSSNDI